MSITFVHTCFVLCCPEANVKMSLKYENIEFNYDASTSDYSFNWN